MEIQYRHSIPAKIDRTSASAWLNKHSRIISQISKPSSLMAAVVCKSKLLSVVRSGTCGRINALETGWQSDVRSCILSGMHTHLVHELNVGTVLPTRQGLLRKRVAIENVDTEIENNSVMEH